MKLDGVEVGKYGLQEGETAGSLAAKAGHKDVADLVGGPGTASQVCLAPALLLSQIAFATGVRIREMHTHESAEIVATWCTLAFAEETRFLNAIACWKQQCWHLIRQGSQSDSGMLTIPDEH